jgi:hypothetical protein
MVRIDPLDTEGKFDTEFFGSAEYPLFRAKVEWYILQEGFDLEQQTHILCLFNRYWQVQITPFKSC